MPAPDGPQWLQLYRGLAHASPDTLDKSGVGRHWSSNRWVAESFGTDGLADDEPSMVIGALVHKKHIIPENTEEWSKEAERFGAIGSDSPESEFTVRRGAPIHITSITHYPNSTDESVMFRHQMGLKDLRKYRA